MPEFYHKNIFGDVVDTDLTLEEKEENLVGNKPKVDFNIFSLTDAVGNRDKRNAWLLYQKALVAGMVPEEVFYKIVWQVKSLLLAKNTNSAEEAGMKAYPYSKAKSALRNFKEGELEELSEKLVVGYHEARRGNGEMETFVEKMVLGL